MYKKQDWFECAGQTGYRTYIQTQWLNGPGKKCAPTLTLLSVNCGRGGWRWVISGWQVERSCSDGIYTILFGSTTFDPSEMRVHRHHGYLLMIIHAEVVGAMSMYWITCHCVNKKSARRTSPPTRRPSPPPTNHSLPPPHHRTTKEVRLNAFFMFSFARLPYTVTKYAHTVTRPQTLNPIIMPKPLVAFIRSSRAHPASH